MASKKKISAGKSDRFFAIKKMFAAVSMLSFIVIFIVGIRAEARMVTIAYRSTAVMLVILTVSRIVIKVLSGYEEMNSGKAETNRS